MKTTTKIAAALLGALAATTGAQSTEGFPQCAQWCITSMQEANKTSELGCAPGDNACLCRNANFLYGVRDCSAELCASSATSQQATEYTNEFCRNNGVNLATVTSGGGAAPTGGASSGAPSGTGSGGAGASSAISTSAIVSTVTGADGSVTVSTVGSSTIFGPGGASGTATTVTSAELTTITSGSSTITSTLGSTTFVTTPTPTESEGGSETGGSGTGSGSGPSTTSSSTGFAPQMTAAPAGIFAAVGIAAFLL